MIDTYQEAKEIIETLDKEFHSVNSIDFNEAKTRLFYIDLILTKVLGWEPKDIHPEDNKENQYADYKLNLFRPVAIWEAKKTGNYFELPIGLKNLVIPIKILIKGNDPLKEALWQVGEYCHKRGIPIGVVSNGWQFVAFVANRNDSTPPMEGDAFVIPSLKSFSENFKEVWNCLSKPGFEENYLFKKLLGGAEKQLPPKLSSTISDYPGIKNRNPFQNELEIISDLVLEDVLKEKDIEKVFLEDCYCKSGALSQYSLVSKEILTTRYNYLYDSNDKKATLEQVATKKGISPELLHLFANSLSKRPILLIGDVGVGKSTFIDNLLLVEAPKILARSITLKIDLGSKAVIALDIKNAIVNIIANLLFSIYNIDVEDDDFVRHCYYLELETFKKSVHVKRLYEVDKGAAIVKEIEFLSNLVADKANHLKNALTYISKSQEKQIIIFIDNCDQRNDSDQETAFLIAQEIATDWPAIVFLALRPETFHNTKKSTGALSGYHTKAFTIPPPRIDDVIKKRLTFAQKITKGELVLSKLNSKTSFSKLDTLIEIFKYSLDNNHHLYKFIENISNGNVRKAIELIKKFFGSGHIDTEKMLRIVDESGYYTIPVHELLRSVIYGDNFHFNPNASEVVNIFDVRTFDAKEHFIISIILGMLFDYSQNNRNQGFISLQELFNHVQGLGYIPEQIDTTINFMYSKGLFETSQRGNKLSENSELMIRSTGLGSYHINFLINSFTYIDAIIVDVPIFKESIKDVIINTTDISHRLNRAKIFKTYLDTIWAESKFPTTYFNWPQKSQELENDITKIVSKVQHAH